MQGIVLIISNSAGICEIIELSFWQAFGTIQRLVSLILALLLAFISLFLPLPQNDCFISDRNRSCERCRKHLGIFCLVVRKKMSKRETEILDMNSHMSGTLFLSPVPSRRGPSV